jgi:hypothetical protein
MVSVQNEEMPAFLIERIDMASVAREVGPKNGPIVEVDFSSKGLGLKQ